MLVQVSVRCFELDKKPLIEPMLSLWVSLVSLAGCVNGNFKTDFERLTESHLTDGQSFVVVSHQYIGLTATLTLTLIVEGT